MIIIYLQDKNLVLRRLNDIDKDYRYLTGWYQDEEVYKSFEQRKLNYEEVKKKYYPRTLLNSKVKIFFIEYEKKPIGIIQYQILTKEKAKVYNINYDDTYEIDIFIGDKKKQGKSIGKSSLNFLCNYLFANEKCNNIILCVLEDNIIAINFYKACGFKILKKLNLLNTIGEEKSYYLMQKKK